MNPIHLDRGTMAFVASVGLCVGAGPFASCGFDQSGESNPRVCTLFNSTLLVRLPVTGHIVGEGIIRVGGAHQGLDAKQDRSDLQRRTPLV